MPDEDEDLFVPADEPEVPEPDAPEPDEDTETLQISFEGEDPPKPAAGADSDLVRQLRQELRDKERRLRELQPAPKPIEVGDKPTMESSGYDEAAFEEALEAWKDRKAKADAEVAARKKAQDDTNAAWQRDLDAFNEKKAALRAPDFDNAEQTVIDNLPPGYPQAIVKAAKDGAKVMYALAKHPDKLAALAKLDMVQFIAEVARMEGQITVNTTRRPPPPEGTVRGSAPLSKTTDKELERLNAKAAADPNFDRGEIVRYKRKLEERRRGSARP